MQEIKNNKMQEKGSKKAHYKLSLKMYSGIISTICNDLGESVTNSTF